MSLAPETLLQGRYRIVSQLGQGGMGAVYRAWDIPVALKEMVLPLGLQSSGAEALREQFHQEAAVLARLHHPNLVSVSDFFDEGGRTYLVMAFVEGVSLARRIEEEGPLPQKQVLVWADQLLSALSYCHQEGVIHRDIKPQNVILRPDGQAILVDFGLAKVWNPDDPQTRTVIRSMGTPQYAPPEQYDPYAGHTDQRSDVYSLGATLYHALTGSAPPTATTRIVEPSSMTTARVQNSEVSARVNRALARALALRPDERFSTVDEMRAALMGRPVASYCRGAEADTSATGPQTRRPHVPGWGWVIAALVVISISGGIGALAGRRNLDLSAGGGAPSDIVSPTSTATSTVEPQSVAPTTTRRAPPTPTVTLSADRGDTPTLPPTEPVSPALPALLPTDTPAPTPSPTPTQVCPPVAGPFADLWEARRDRLGCTESEPSTTWVALEPFDHGVMFWRKDDGRIYVLYDTGIWQDYADTWQEGEAEYSCPESAPSQSPPTPRRGFGKVWCTQPGVRQGMGNAIDVEDGYNAIVQPFGGGTLIRLITGGTYIMYSDDTWQNP